MNLLATDLFCYWHVVGTVAGLAVVVLLLRRTAPGRTAWHCLWRDLTGHRRAKQALEQNTTELRAIYENAPLVMMLVDRERRVHKINAAALSMGRRSASEAIGLRGGEALRCIHAEEHPEGCGYGPTCKSCGIRNAVKATFRSGTPVHRMEASVCHEHRDGPRDLHALVSTKRLDHLGEPLVLVCLEDITEQKKTQNALRIAKNFTESIINSMADMLVVVSPTGHIVNVNRAACEQLGFREEDLLGQLATLLFDEEDAGDVVADAAWPSRPAAIGRTVLRRVVSEDPLRNIESSMTTRSGRKMPVLLSGALMRDDAGTIQGIVCVALDDTRRKQAERELREAKNEAEAASRAKSFFLANMSHEIRTPMTAILGFTDILLNGLTEPRARDAAQTVKRNGKHLLQIINDILDLSKIEAGRIETQMSAVSPQRIVAEVISLLHVRAQARNLTLSDEYDGPIPETITTDPDRLRQILINLVGNAIKATDAGGVRIVTRLVEHVGPEPQLQFDVTDTGVGIPANQIEQLFQPFVQGECASERQPEGTGLGLTISRQLALLLGGDITVRSVMGEGSTFTLAISAGPLHGARLVDHTRDLPNTSDSPEDSTCRSKQQLDCRVLLAEDIPDNQRLISTILSEFGAEVTIARDGQEAVEVALGGGESARFAPSATRHFDIIFMDIQMPKMDGHEATRRLRLAGYDGPIVALTAHAMRGDRQKSLDAGCDDHVTKPIDRNTLFETLQTWVSWGRRDGATLSERNDKLNQWGTNLAFDTPPSERHDPREIPQV